jgi:PhnB protein
VDGDLVMHAALKLGDGLLMASDDPTGKPGRVEGVSINYGSADAAEVRRAFDALAEGGEVTQPLIETFFSPAFGTCVDRFGVSWMLTVDPPQG